jgi:hypothetical protein
MLLKYARKAALAAAHVQDTPTVQAAEIFHQQLHMIDAWINGGWKVFLVRRPVIEVLDNFRKQRRRRPS